jgi:tripartite-type tricarboxylate transporter receptor subunit TctC
VTAQRANRHSHTEYVALNGVGAPCHDDEHDKNTIGKPMMRLALAPVLAFAMASGALAQSGAEGRWPDTPIRMIVPLPAGSAVDIVARLICTKLSERIGQTIVVDNRSGASGAIASDVVAKSAPDGYTLGMATSTTHVTTAILNSKLPYDPVKDFVPVALIGIVPYVLAVSPQLAAKNLSELLALAKAKPGTLNYSSVGLGSLAHLATEMMSTMAGIKMNHIPYRASGPAILDMSENRIDLSIGVLGTFLSLIRDGKIRALAVTTDKRVDTVPDVPTMAEAGLPGFEASLWFAVVAPAAIPQPVLARLNKEINAILAEPGIKKSLAAQAVDVETSGPEKLRARIRADIEKWRDIAAKAGVKSE